MNSLKLFYSDPKPAFTYVIVVFSVLITGGCSSSNSIAKYRCFINTNEYQGVGVYVFIDKDSEGVRGETPKDVKFTVEIFNGLGEDVFVEDLPDSDGLYLKVKSIESGKVDVLNPMVRINYRDFLLLKGVSKDKVTDYLQTRRKTIIADDGTETIASSMASTQIAVPISDIPCVAIIDDALLLYSVKEKRILHIPCKVHFNVP